MGCMDLLCMIDNIDVITESSELDVMTSLMNVYMKEAQLIQEGFMDEINAPIKGKEGESILEKIAMFIPRLIAKIIRMIVRIVTQFKRKRLRDTDSKYLEKELRSARFNNRKEAEDFLKAKNITPGGVYASDLSFDIASDPDNNNYYIISVSLYDVYCYQSDKDGTSFFTEPDFEKWIDELSRVAYTLLSTITQMHSYLDMNMKSGVDNINNTIKKTYEKMKEIDGHVGRRMQLQLNEVWRFVNPSGGITDRLNDIKSNMESIRSMGGSHFWLSISAKQGERVAYGKFSEDLYKNRVKDLAAQQELQKKMNHTGFDFDIETFSNTMLELARHVGMFSTAVDKIADSVDEVKKAMRKDTMKEIKRDVLNA